MPLRAPQVLRSPAGSSVTPTGLLVAMAALLFHLRWFRPAEDAGDGATLWLATAWCVLAAAWTWRLTQNAIRPKFGWADAAVALLVLGHVGGGFLVIFGTGNKRLAANLLAEWIGLGATWWVLRDVFAQMPGGAAWRSAFWQGSLVALTLIACVGCWQHWIELPQMAREYGPKIDAVRAARAAGVTSEFEAELSRSGIPLRDPDLRLFEKRLRDSREPFAFFALANTLGGFMGSALVFLAIGQPFGSTLIRAARVQAAAKTPAVDARSTTVSRVILNGMMPLVARIAVAFCLLISKSRTAWLGTVTALAMRSLLAIVRRPRKGWTRRNRWVAAGLALAGLGVVGFLIASGSWDVQVFVEAPRSVQFRWLYWTGAAALIRQAPLGGVGLGQFRNRYLEVKWPSASEEIVDPHNSVFDAWVNGGILAALGVVSLYLLTVRRIWRSSATADAAGPESKPDRYVSQASPQDTVVDPETVRRTPHPSLATSRNPHALVMLAAAAAPWGVLLTHSTVAGGWDDRLVLCGLVAVVWSLAIAQGLGGLPIPSPAVATIGLFSVLLHLLGAGGLGLPAVVQWMFFILADGGAMDGDFPLRVTSPHWGLPGRWWAKPRLQGVCWLVIAVAVGLLIWRPQSLAARALLDTDGKAERGATLSSLQRGYERAAAADLWDPQPLSRLAELHVQEWENAGRPVHADRWPPALTAAVDALDAALRRDPGNVRWLWRRGEIERQFADRSHDSEAAKRAAATFAEAARRYPTNAQLLTDWSDAADLAGEAETAHQAAKAALDQDKVNKRWGHQERILTDDARRRMEARAASGVQRSN